jgi:hypothetical protein
MPARTPVRRDHPDYLRTYRGARPRTRERQRAQQRAWSIASARLRERYRDEFEAIYAEEKAEVGL